ncbi:MAG: GNAT family N-acetyltransferase [Dehalococcoidia bacterium]
MTSETQLTLPIETERLLLREFEPSDWEGLLTYNGDPEVQRFRGRELLDTAGAHALIATMRGRQAERPRTWYDLAIIRRLDGRQIGRCERQLAHGSTGEIGYMLARDVWGQGYATEAARALLTAGFGALGLHRIYAECELENTASWRVLERLGMRREGHFQEALWRGGRWHDALTYALLRSEWAARVAPAVGR